METKSINIAELSPAVRQRKYDFVQGPDLENGTIWHFGRIIGKEGGVIRCEDKNGDTFAIPSTHLYKSNRDEFMADHEEVVAPEIPAEVEETEETEEKPVKRLLVNPDWSRYTKHPEIKTASGKVSIDIDDEVAAVLRGLNLEDVYDTVARYIREINKYLTDEKAMEKLDTVEKLEARYGHLNPGMQRMNLGNKLRGALVRAEMDRLPVIPWIEE